VKILLVDTYYENFLKNFYKKNKYLNNSNYEKQLENLLKEDFGTSDSYSYFLRKNNIEAEDLIVNCQSLQKAWAENNNLKYPNVGFRVPLKFSKIPFIGKRIENIKVLYKIAKEQIRVFKPDVLYCQDLSFFPPDILNEIKKQKNIKLIVGQIACPLPPTTYIKNYDLILTSFPHFVDKLNSQGVKSEYFKIGFDERILSKAGPLKKDINFSFIGGISRHHNLALKNIEYLVSKSDLQVYGYGSNKLPINSIVRKMHNGERWGLNMYKILGKSKISFNRHINVSENYANNMRLYEATGMGSLLLTDKKDNLHKLFEIDREIVTYSCKEEAAEKSEFLLSNPLKASQIAAAGQARTLKDHTYDIRMQELIEILRKYL
tara:strand:- start:146 stop:1273 length:1128 start_codon:yes stop_codon:yes gene_type:complete